ncbi:MAG: GGDEF domain-containing protein, partial [Rhodospirillaceae bacterium]|nr:GGDEF domain-containing protein [Rhodospirillaceae bacterium]
MSSAHRLPLPALTLAPYGPYIFGALGAGLGLWFKRTRVFLFAALISVAHWALNSFPPDANETNLLIVFAALAVLFPINVITIAFMRECSLWSVGVFSRILFVAAQISLMAILLDASDGARQTANIILHYRPLDKAIDYWTMLPQPAIILFSIAIAVFIARAIYTRSAIDGGLAGAVIAIAMALHSPLNIEVSSIIIALGQAVIIIAVVQDTYRMAFIDELTSLPGRRALMMDMNAQGNRYCVAMLDVDHFKKFNDTYGHDVGDQVLKLVASRMMEVRGGGKAYRYGGEEFTILFPGKSLDHALVHLEAVRKAIGESHFHLRADDRPKTKPDGSKNTKAAPKAKAKKNTNEMVSVTISIGASERSDGQNQAQTLKAADEALYRAKDAGR